MKKVIGNDYFELVRRFPLRPIRNEKELAQAVAVIDDLIVRETRTAEADDYLEVLSDLVEKYEAANHPIPDASPDDVLKFLIEDRKTNQRAVALGSQIPVSTISEILSGRREMNLEHMRKLAGFFRIDVGSFLPKADGPTSRRQPPVKQAAAKK